MLLLTSKNAQKIYTCLQGLYWATYAFMFSFASVYLQGQQFSDSEIGIFLACTYIIAVIFQLLFSKLISYSKISLEKFSIIILLVDIFLSLILLLFVLNKTVVALILVILFASQYSLQPTFTAIAKHWNKYGLNVDYSSSRGLASLFLGVVALGFGKLLTLIPSNYIPAFYMSCSLLVMVLLLIVKLPLLEIKEDKDTIILGMPITNHVIPIVLLISIVCLSFGHTAFDNFLLQLIQSRGGNSANQGIALATGAFVECIAMKLYPFLSKKISVRNLLIIAGWSWVAKLSIAYISPNPQVIYCAEVMQFFSFGIYTPAIVDFIGKHFTSEQYLNLLSYIGSAFTVGNILSCVVGGMVIDRFGVNSIYYVAIMITAAGALIMTIIHKNNYYSV